MISTLVISRYAAPPFPLRGTSPLCRGQNKTLRDNLLINPPLEMTVAAGTPLVISTEAEWRNLTPPMKEKPARALRHFDRSGAEWRNLPL